jgi:cytosine/adenosine deaminase-related metal-dependent hydrolase
MAEDRFDAAYLRGSGDVAADEPAIAGPPRERREGIAPSQAVALKGCVLTPEQAIDPGYVVVDAGTIASVGDKAPDGVPVTDTQGVIAPGLIDLHGHPEFNVFAAWDPPRMYDNRYEWRGSDLYHTLVRDPQNKLLDTLPHWTQLRYAEVRALVGGVTAIQGSGEQATQYQDEALVRNVDKWIFGGQVGRSMIDLPSGSRGADTLTSVLKGIADGKVKAFYIHLAEGRSDNERSVKEFDSLVSQHALTEATVVIHGTALSEDQLGDVRDAGASLVWSPQSNLRLYGETTRAAHALDIGLPVGLGADWLPSGSTSLLAELTVARHALATQTGTEPDPRKLVDMVTRDAAKIAGLDDKLGTIAEGRPADLAVFERHRDDPWLNIVIAEPAWVELVMIGGDVAYGHTPVVESLVGADALARFEALTAWGKPMQLDTGYQAKPGATPLPKLAELRSDLIAQYPQVGPIFA